MHYTSFHWSLDFGTVKGLSLAYDLRRLGNLRGRVSYTLQFAEGTGSNATAGLNLARTGKQNLRTTIPLGYDQRHTIVANIDYRYGAGKDYNGPLVAGKQLFAATGTNLIFNAGSGTPYSRQSNVTAENLITAESAPTRGGTQILQGQLNGARYPWQFRIDAGLDRDIKLTWGKDEENKKEAQLNIYFQISNVLNTKNVIRVYRSTGNPDDDGYLQDAQWNTEITASNDEQAYRELYALRMNAGRHYTLPRRFKLGVRVNF